MLDKQIAKFIKYSCDYDVDTIVDKSYEILKIIESLGFAPFYTTMGKPNNAVLEVYNKKRVREEILRNYDEQFLDLGTSICTSYSTSGNFDSEDDTGFIHLGFGNYFEKLVNVGFFDIIDIVEDEILIRKFAEIASIYNPDIAYIVSRQNLDITNTENEDRESKMPRTVQWVNYWSNDIINKIGINNIEEAVFYKIEKLNNGYLLILQEHRINNTDEAQIANQNKVINHLSKFW